MYGTDPNTGKKSRKPDRFRELDRRRARTGTVFVMARLEWKGRRPQYATYMRAKDPEGNWRLICARYFYDEPEARRSVIERARADVPGKPSVSVNTLWGAQVDGVMQQLRKDEPKPRVFATKAFADPQVVWEWGNGQWYRIWREEP